MHLFTAMYTQAWPSTFSGQSFSMHKMHCFHKFA